MCGECDVDYGLYMMIIYISCVCVILVHSLYTEVIHSSVSTETLGVQTIVDIMVHYYQNSVTIFM